MSVHGPPAIVAIGPWLNVAIRLRHRTGQGTNVVGPASRPTFFHVAPTVVRKSEHLNLQNAIAINRNAKRRNTPAVTVTPPSGSPPFVTPPESESNTVEGLGTSGENGIETNVNQSAGSREDPSPTRQTLGRIRIQFALQHYFAFTVPHSHFASVGRMPMTYLPPPEVRNPLPNTWERQRLSAKIHGDLYGSGGRETQGAHAQTTTAKRTIDSCRFIRNFSF